MSRFVLSANFHAGSEVASYPYDSSKQHRAGVYSKAPDDPFFKVSKLVMHNVVQLIIILQCIVSLWHKLMQMLMRRCTITIGNVGRIIFLMVLRMVHSGMMFKVRYNGLFWDFSTKDSKHYSAKVLLVFGFVVVFVV